MSLSLERAGAGVSAELRADGSGSMFDAIARRYDLLNRVLSLGLDRRWRRRAIAALELEPGSRVLDLATGTADLAIEIARRTPGAEVVGIDPSPKMLEIGRRKVERRGLSDRIRLDEGYAQSLPYRDESFDAAAMAFGIRNVQDRSQALTEIRRALRPGGSLAILELGEPRSGALARVSRFHIHVLVPKIGGLLSGPAAYRYLERSIAAFPSRDEFVAQVADAGFEVEQSRPLTFGVTNLFLARRPS